MGCIRHKAKTRGWHRLLYLALGMFLLCFLLPLFSYAAIAEDRQYKLEAAFLYNFFNYIAWPGYHTPEDLKHATICIESNDPLQPYLEYIKEKKLGQRTFKIIPLSADSDIKNCQIFFVRSTSQLTEMHSSALAKGVLLVSDAPDFVENGGMIGLSPEGERMAIEINNTGLKQADFNVSSLLLNLARKVE